MPAYEVNLFLNRVLICTRYGYQCATSLVNYFNKGALCRISIGIYNTYKEADVLIYAIKYLCDFSARLRITHQVHT